MEILYPHVMVIIIKAFCFAGKNVMLVNGAYRGQTATLESIKEKKFSCTVSLNTVRNIPYLLGFKTGVFPSETIP